MPNNTTAFLPVCARQQTADGFLDRTKLLVAADDFDQLAFVVGLEQRKRPYQAKQVILVQHTGHQALLVIGAAGAVLQIVQAFGVGIGPAVEVALCVRCDGSKLRLLAAGGNNELIEIEELRNAFFLFASLLAVAHHLVYRFGDRFLDLWGFAFDQHDGQTVHEEHDVGKDVVLRGRHSKLGLRNSDEGVVVPVFKIYDSDRGIRIAGLAILR